VGNVKKEEVGQRFKIARELYGVLNNEKITQAKLSEMVNQSRGYIGDIESGRTYPTLSVLFEITEALNIPIEHFVSEGFSLQNYLFKRKDESDESNLLEKYRKLSSINKQTVWNLINSLEIIDTVQNHRKGEGGEDGRGRDAVSEKEQ
jgi:transcriptional regulator with XRE-family HTH domain